MNKEDKNRRDTTIVNSYYNGGKKKDLAYLHNMSLSNINRIIRDYDYSNKLSAEEDREWQLDYLESIENIKKFSNEPLQNKHPLLFKNKYTANLILEIMVEAIVLRGQASLAYFSIINNMLCKKPDHFSGWDNASFFIRNSKIINNGPDYGYSIRLAPTKKIEYDNISDILQSDRKVRIYES